MAAQLQGIDWNVTPEKVDEAGRRIVETAKPLQIIAFGSRARVDHWVDSDLDLAVILDVPQNEVHRVLPYTVPSGILMPVDMIVASREKYDLHARSTTYTGRGSTASTTTYGRRVLFFMTVMIQNMHVQTLACWRKGTNRSYNFRCLASSLDSTPSRVAKRSSKR